MNWQILLISLWIQVGFVPGIHCKDGTVSHLSSEDVLLLEDDLDPKCFSRTEQDFTCFFETADNRTYDLLYKSDSLPGKKRCEMSVQRTEVGTLLHICSFPGSDVFLFVEIHLEVVERNTNTRLYSRVVCVEDQLLLDPPFSVSLNQNGQAGQLEVSWHIKVTKYFEGHVMYKIRYSSNSLGEKIKETKECSILDSLVPGEEVEVQVSVRCASNPNTGHWSGWSHPVRAVVPQSADDISLMCYTSDLQNITCLWHGSRYGEENVYKLLYKMGLSEDLGWTEWTECLADSDVTELCHFRGEESRRVRVKLSSTSAPLSRTLYTQEFTLSNSVKTSPPCHLKGTLEKDKLCLKWEAPLLSLSAHLQYEVSCQISQGEAWIKSLKGPETGTCREVPTGSRYSVKIRAKPNGSIYSGHWSDWSNVLTGDVPADIGTLLMLCIPVLMLMIAIILISFFSTYHSKLKLYFWPPVPDLDKVLQSFLTEVTGPQWNPLITAKQYSDETTSSVVEIMSEDDVSQSGVSTRLLSLERQFCSREQVDGSPGTKVFPDYVTLNKDSVILCPKGNKYVYEEVGEKGGPEMSDELFQTCQGSCPDGSVCIPPCSGSDFLNHAYLPLAEPADRIDCKVTVARGPGNLYTNFPCS
ncbi:thrombopoietin receptor isoform X1 [Anarrhichthys ocellatus]|uniref:thrombopoietin receptor isoform X1 n=2 Tax=Anarrhichthys ocellatus TaxID=433405 RepID=UPI0012ECEECB|nr:thrombopoietin receptor isoform X1 [Anarrhichthys ocellatus]